MCPCKISIILGENANIPDDFLGVAGPMRIGLVEQYTPFISVMESVFSFSFPNLTNP